MELSFSEGLARGNCGITWIIDDWFYHVGTQRGVNFLSPTIQDFCLDDRLFTFDIVLVTWRHGLVVSNGHA